MGLDGIGRKSFLLRFFVKFAPIVYRLGQEILILQSGVRFPVGAPTFLVAYQANGRLVGWPRTFLAGGCLALAILG